MVREPWELLPWQFCAKMLSSNFNEKHLNVYKYEVLGGLHSFQAKAELLKEISR